MPQTKTREWCLSIRRTLWLTVNVNICNHRNAQTAERSWASPRKHRRDPHCTPRRRMLAIIKYLLNHPRMAFDTRRADIFTCVWIFCVLKHCSGRAPDAPHDCSFGSVPRLSVSVRRRSPNHTFPLYPHPITASRRTPSHVTERNIVPGGGTRIHCAIDARCASDPFKDARVAQMSDRRVWSLWRRGRWTGGGIYSPGGAHGFVPHPAPRSSASPWGFKRTDVQLTRWARHIRMNNSNILNANELWPRPFN